MLVEYYNLQNSHLHDKNFQNFICHVSIDHQVTTRHTMNPS